MSYLLILRLWHSRLLGGKQLKTELYLCLFTCNFLPGSLEGMGSICASVDNVEVLVSRRDHGGNVGFAVYRHEGGTGVSTIVHLHCPSAASDLRK